jgi:hypothetical protein
MRDSATNFGMSEPENIVIGSEEGRRSRYGSNCRLERSRCGHRFAQRRLRELAQSMFRIIDRGGYYSLAFPKRRNPISYESSHLHRGSPLCAGETQVRETHRGDMGLQRAAFIGTVQ